MRWDDLFDDLVAQARTLEAGGVTAEVEDRSRWELGQLDVNDRVLGWTGASAVLFLVDGSTVRGRLRDAGADWLSVREPRGDVLVPSAAVARITLPPAAGPGPQSRPRQRVRLVQVFRHAARDRAYVRLALRGDQVASGTVDAAAADHVQLAEHDVDVPRRQSVVRSSSLVPYAAILLARGEGGWLG